MFRDRLLQRIRSAERDLRDRGVEGLSLFGSVARGEETPDSDIDVAVRLNKRLADSGLAWFAAMDEVRRRLETIAGCTVDLVAEPTQRAALQSSIDKDRLIAF